MQWHLAARWHPGISVARRSSVARGRAWLRKRWPRLGLALIRTEPRRLRFVIRGARCSHKQTRIMATTTKPILCVDFDGVIHSYTSGWKGDTIISDPPVPGALRWLWRATEYFNVQVYSSRSKNPDARAAMLAWICQYSQDEFGHDHPMATRPDHKPYPIVFAHEKPAAFLTIDDRAICFNGYWSDLEPAELLKFKPWNKRNG